MAARALRGRASRSSAHRGRRRRWRRWWWWFRRHGGRRGRGCAPATRPTAAGAGGVAVGGERRDYLQRDRPDRQDQGMGRDVRRRLALDEVPVYDPKLHGTDWDAMRPSTSRWSPCRRTHELMNVINEMIGELNASHTGARRRRPRRAPRASRHDRHLGIDLEADAASGRYKVADVYEDGPADKDWIKVETGNYLIAIDGKELKAGDDYDAFLGAAQPQGPAHAQHQARRPKGRGRSSTSRSRGGLRQPSLRALGRRSGAPWSTSSPATGSATCTSRRWISPRWRSSRRSSPSSATRRDWSSTSAGTAAATSSRSCWRSWCSVPTRSGSRAGVEPTERPFTGYFGPKVVLQNWRSASNAEMFPAGFRASAWARWSARRRWGRSSAPAAIP